MGAIARCGEQKIIMSSSARAEGYDTPAQQREAAASVMVCVYRVRACACACACARVRVHARARVRVCVEVRVFQETGTLALLACHSRSGGQLIMATRK